MPVLDRWEISWHLLLVKMSNLDVLDDWILVLRKVRVGCEEIVLRIELIVAGRKNRLDSVRYWLSLPRRMCAIVGKHMLTLNWICI